MAAGSKVGVTPGTGLNLATGPTYTEASSTVQDEKVILGEQYLPTYVAISGSGISAATAASHLMQVGGSALKTYIRRIRITQVAAATTAAMADILLVRLSSAGTGGTVITPAPWVTTDPAAAAAAMTLPTVKGTESTGIYRESCYFMQTIPVSGGKEFGVIFDFDCDRLRTEPIEVPVGASNYLAIKLNTAIAAATVTVTVTFSEAGF